MIPNIWRWNPRIENEIEVQTKNRFNNNAIEVYFFSVTLSPEMFQVWTPWKCFQWLNMESCVASWMADQGCEDFGFTTIEGSSLFWVIKDTPGMLATRWSSQDVNPKPNLASC